MLVGNHILAATEDNAGLVSELVTSRLFCLAKKKTTKKATKLVRNHILAAMEDKAVASELAGQWQALLSRVLPRAACPAFVVLVWTSAWDQRESKTLSLPLSSHPAAPAKGRTCLSSVKGFKSSKLINTLEL